MRAKNMLRLGFNRSRPGAPMVEIHGQPHGHVSKVGMSRAACAISGHKLLPRDFKFDLRSYCMEYLVRRDFSAKRGDYAITQ